MKANIPIHLVKRKNYDVLNDIYVFFDSKEKATPFVDKIKYRPDIKITNGILYPDYSVDKTTALYSTPMAQRGHMPKYIPMCDYNLIAEYKKERYNIFFYGDSKLQSIHLENICFRPKRCFEKDDKYRQRQINDGQRDLAEKY